MPRAVIDAVAAAHTEAAGSPNRGVHALAEAATVALDQARAEVAQAVGAPPSELVFTSGATAAVNLVAAAWGRANVGPGDVVVATELEHHSNLVPWQQLCAERGARLELLRVDDGGAIELHALPAATKLVAVAHVSNVVGTIAPIAELAARAHAAGALLFVDGAQAVAHLPVDVAALGCDFYAFSAHKMYGPPGIGALWARGEVLAAMAPWQTGGGMVTTVDDTASRFREPPFRFEAGTPNWPGAVGFAAAARFLARADRSAEPVVHAALIAAVIAAGGTVLGRPQVGVVAFTLPGVHPHDIATIADGEGVALRSGHHCAQPIHRRFGVTASARASVACYSGLADVEQFARALAKVREVFQR